MLCMSASHMRPLTDDERDQMRQWLENWRRVGPLLEDERWNRVAALTDDEAWAQSQSLLQMWELGMIGDDGEELHLHQSVFGRWGRARER
jgi:hypothetical protein